MVERDLSIGFIGIGVLGKGLPLALAAQGYRVTGGHSRSAASAQWLADRIPGCRVFQTAQELSDATDLVFITTPDSVIGTVAGSVNWRGGQGVVHCCGAETTEILAPAAGHGALTGSFHPFQTFAGLHDPEDAKARLSGVTFAVSGDGWLAEYLSGMAQDLGGSAIHVADEDRPLYHAAAVLSCGHLVALLQAAANLWQAMGVSQERAVEALYPLARATLENVAQHGLTAAATGPVIRGDTATLRTHLEALFQRAPELVPLYGSLARESLPLAARHGAGPDQISSMEELIDHYVSFQ